MSEKERQSPHKMSVDNVTIKQPEIVMSKKALIYNSDQ